MPLWILLDENAGSIALAAALRASGFTVATMADLGRLGRSDEDQLTFAASGRWILFTFDVGDFSHLHWVWLGAGKQHNGIVVETDALLPVGALLRGFDALAKVETAETLTSRLVYLRDYRERDFEVSEP